MVTKTITIKSPTTDGRVYDIDTNYDTCWAGPSPTVVTTGTNDVFTGQYKIAANYGIYRGMIFFNTIIPSTATITSAVLRLKPQTISVTGGDFTVVIQSGMPTYPHETIETGDFADGNYSGNYGSAETTDMIVDTYKEIEINDFSIINKSGITKFCVRSSKDIAKTAPTNTERVYFYSGGSSGNEPELVIIFDFEAEGGGLVPRHDWKRYPELTSGQAAKIYFQSPHRQIFETFKATVVKVTDGDTIRVKWSERDFNFPVRFLNIRSPEMDEEGGPESQSWLENKILGREVEIIIDPNKKVEKWGRLLGNVTFKGLDMGEESIFMGHSIPWEQI